MPYLKTYDLFISHAWVYGDQYLRIVEMLRLAPNFTFRNYSAPSDKPLVPTGTTISNMTLRIKIENKIAPVNAVLVLAGMYVAYRDWIQFEIDTAIRRGKPIIGIEPWSSERTPLAVSSVADVMVGWNTNSIVNAIREYAL